MRVGSCTGLAEGAGRIAGHGVAGRAQERVAQELGVFAMEVGVGVAHEVGVGPRGQQVVLEVVAQEGGVFVGQAIDGGLAAVERGPDAGPVLFDRRLLPLGRASRCCRASSAQPEDESRWR